jgi:hypothetical protein
MRINARANMRGQLLVSLVALALLLLPGTSWAEQRESQPGNSWRAHSLRVPSRSFPTIQSAVDAAADGATILIAHGIFRERITVIGKRLRIVGSGAAGKNRTVILADTPREVLPVGRAHGLVTYAAGGGGSLENVAIVGGDAGILGAGREASAATLTVSNVEISQSGRGILWQGGALSVSRIVVSDSLRHGIVVIDAAHFSIVDSVVLGGTGAPGGTEFGIYISGGACSTLQNVQVFNVTKGGIAVLDSCAVITESFFFLNKTAHVWSKNSHTEIYSSTLEDSLCVEQPDLTCLFGDGVVFLGGSGIVHGSLINDSDRAGISAFGAAVGVGSTTIGCSAFDLNSEIFEGVPAQFEDLGGNECGCPLPGGSCAAVSSSLTPPGPVDPEP